VAYDLARYGVVDFYHVHFVDVGHVKVMHALLVKELKERKGKVHDRASVR